MYRAHHVVDALRMRGLFTPLHLSGGRHSAAPTKHDAVAGVDRTAPNSAENNTFDPTAVMRHELVVAYKGREYIMFCTVTQKLIEMIIGFHAN